MAKKKKSTFGQMLFELLWVGTLFYIAIFIVPPAYFKYKFDRCVKNQGEQARAECLTEAHDRQSGYYMWMHLIGINRTPPL